MQNQTAINNAQANQQTTITFRAVAPLEGSEESSTLWAGGRANSTRNIALSQPLPEINAADIAALPAEQLAEFINSSFLAYVKRVKVQRMELGDSISITLPSGGMELAITMLTTLTEGSRTRKELTAATIRDAINSDAFKAALAAYCQQRSIAPDAFKRLVIDEHLKRCTAGDFCIYQSRASIAAKATAHIAALSAIIRQANPTAARTLELAAQAIAAAPAISDDDAI